MIIFQDHVPNGLASTFFGGIIYRFSKKLSLGLSDNSLINQVLDGYIIDNLYTIPITARRIAEQAKTNNLYFIINNNSQWYFKDIPPGYYGKISGACANALERLGLTKDNSAIALMNEPNKFGDENWYLDCVDWSNYYVKGRYPLILINDEYNCYNNDYILENTGYIKNRLFGVHLLSCLGYPPKLKNIEYAATTAAKWGLPVICTEGGSWFKSYESLEGWDVIRKLIDKCNSLNYFGCAIVMPDINITGRKRYHLLGFKVWTDDYKNLKSESRYWNDFVNYIKEFKDIKEPIIGDDDMKLEKFYYQDRPINLIKIDIKGFGIRLLRACFRLSDSNVFDAALTSEVSLYQANKGLLVDGIVGLETFASIKKMEDFALNYCWVHSLWARGL